MLFEAPLDVDLVAHEDGVALADTLELARRLGERLAASDGDGAEVRDRDVERVAIADAAALADSDALLVRDEL